MKIKLEGLKPRNFVHKNSMHLKAGVHEKSKKAVRKLEKQRFQKDLKNSKSDLFSAAI